VPQISEVVGGQLKAPQNCAVVGGQLKRHKTAIARETKKSLLLFE